MPGPLNGLRVIEIAGIGPLPFAAMLLADLGAEVIRIDRPVPVKAGRPRPLKYNLPFRNRASVALDLKSPNGIATVLEMVETADVLIEGFRPGTLERLGLGPEDCWARNKRLVYGRMTGWGQSGPLSQAAGHDINYIALAGALGAIGRAGQPPSVPMNLVGDYGGGALYLAFGIMCAIYETRSSGRGQVVDAAIVDGVASMLASFCGVTAAGLGGPRGTNPSDSGSHFYDSYECADGKWICIGAMEDKFYAELLGRLGLEAEDLPAQWDRDAWPALKTRFADLFRSRTRDQWCALLEATDACFAPVLDITEAAAHPHLKSRATYVEVDGVPHPAPAPRFSRSRPGPITGPQAPDPATAEATLTGWVSKATIDRLRHDGFVT